jgi:hypothetical protein
MDDFVPDGKKFEKLDDIQVLLKLERKKTIKLIFKSIRRVLKLVGK